MERLAELLETQPLLIGDPVVFHQIWHLKKVCRVMDWGDVQEAEEEVGGAFCTSEEEDKWLRRLFGLPDGPFDPRPPAGTRRAADEALQRLVQAWVKGILPGWTLTAPKPTPVPRKRGRPPKRKAWEAEALLQEFNDFLTQLADLPDESFTLQPGETQEELTIRAAKVVQTLHRHSIYSFASVPPDTEPAHDASGRANILAWRIVSRPLPAEVATKIARDALRKRRISKPLLIYGLLAVHHTQRREQIRGVIERTEADHPDLDRRRLK